MAFNRYQQIKSILACPFCYSELLLCKDNSIECQKCNKKFFFKKGVPDFFEYDIERSSDSEFQAEQLYNNTFTAKLYNIGRRIVSSEYMPINHVKEFAGSIEKNKVIVELGSGNRRLRDDIINIDIFPFANVDLLADIGKTPFKTNIVDYAILDTVLEHVPEPDKAIKELHRILKPGGKAICIAPFIFPYHGYPKHYSNFSKDGLEYLFRDFSECKIEMNMGPINGLINFLTECFAVTLAGENKFLYTLTKGIVLIPIFYFKYLDRLWNPSGRVIRISSHLCAVVRK